MGGEGERHAHQQHPGGTEHGVSNSELLGVGAKVEGYEGEPHTKGKECQHRITENGDGGKGVVRHQDRHHDTPQTPAAMSITPTRPNEENMDGTSLYVDVHNADDDGLSYIALR